MGRRLFSIFLVVIPANAGVILITSERGTNIYGYPRECGGDPEVDYTIYCMF